MNKTAWGAVVAAAVVFGGAGFWGGTSYAQNQTPSKTAQYVSGRPTGAGFGSGRALGGGVFGSILSIGNGTMTVQLMTATSSGATSGTKIVLYDSSTQVEEMQSVPASSLKEGQSVVVTGTPNSDGSVTATSIQVRPAGVPGGRGNAAPQANQ